MIKVGILGYGNLGRGVEAAVTKSDDMELVAIYTRRDPTMLSIHLIHMQESQSTLQT